MKDIDKLLVTLSSEQKEYLLSQLKVAVFGDIPKEIKTCPCCGTDNFIKHGSYKGVQKFKCKKTSKIFSYKSKSIISGVTKLDKLEELLDLMVNTRYPRLRDITKVLSVSMQTAHDWRNKIITALYKQIELDNQVIEFDETNFRLSRKGRKEMTISRTKGRKLVGDNKYNVKVFMAYSRTTKRLELFVSHMGRTKEKNLENYLGIKKDVVVYSDSHPTYLSYYGKKNILNGVFISKQHVSLTDKEVHNQTLNYHCGALKKLINEDLRGVSTKYLQGYLNWYMFIENCKKEMVSVKNVVMENRVALDIFKQKEREFQYFLKLNGRNDYGTYNDRYYGKVV